MIATKPTHSRPSKFTLVIFDYPKKIVKKAEDLEDSENGFDPGWLHHFFDSEEQVVGYMDPEINLYFTKGSMHALLKIDFEDKKPEAEDLKKYFDENFVQGYYEDETEFLKVWESAKAFVPPGKEIEQFDLAGATYKILTIEDPTDPEWVKYNERIQVWIKFMIENGSYIDSDDEEWKIYTLFEYDMTTKEYSFVGFLTFYIFYRENTMYRCRISQNVIIPPYQRKGLGSKLLEKCYDSYIEDPDCYEFTVEAPNPSFTFLRDFVDLKRILEMGQFTFLKEKFSKYVTEPKEFHKTAGGLSSETIDAIVKKLKIRRQQVGRVFEIAVMAVIDFGKDERMTDFFRAWLKRRIENQNKDTIITKIKKKHIEVDDELQEIPIQELQNQLPACKFFVLISEKSENQNR
jgi:histone acetyltransferase 1